MTKLTNKRMADIGMFLILFGALISATGGFILTKYSRQTQKERHLEDISQGDAINRNIDSTRKSLEDRDLKTTEMISKSIKTLKKMAKKEINNSGVHLENSPNSIVQNNVNSPGSIQTVNKKRVIKQNLLTEKGNRNDLHLLRLTFTQTDGIWDSGEKFWLTIQLSGSYKNYSFTSGYPPNLPLFDVVTTQNNPKAAELGYIELQTATAPLNEPIIIEIESLREIDVKEIRCSPTDL